MLIWHKALWCGLHRVWKCLVDIAKHVPVAGKAKASDALLILRGKCLSITCPIAAVRADIRGGGEGGGGDVTSHC